MVHSFPLSRPPKGPAITGRRRILLAISQWGDRHLADQQGPPTEFVHRDCEQPLHLQVHCAGGHRLESPREVATRPGPGVLPFAEALHSE